MHRCRAFDPVGERAGDEAPGEVADIDQRQASATGERNGGRGSGEGPA